MGTCNVAQNETGGKFLHLKICLEKTFSTTATSSDVTVTAHKAKVGDLVKFSNVDGNTVINTTTYYFITQIVDANKFKISATPAGTAIVMDDTSAIVAGEIFMGLGGIRSKEVSGSSEAIDVSNQDSDEWKVILDGAGQRSFSISGSGVLTNTDAYTEAETKFLANLLTCLMFVDLKSLKAKVGCFKITEISNSGDYNAEGQFSISAESSGPVSFVTF